jgi:ABC-2 type transport system permease protein
MFIFFVVVYSSTFLIESKVRGSVMLDKWPVVVVNMIFMVLVSLSLGILAARVCKNENTISIVVQMIAWVTCFVGGSFAPLELLPKTVQYFSKFTPQFWALKSIDTGNYALALIGGLFALVLFTAGTFKTRKFI